MIHFKAIARFLIIFSISYTFLLLPQTGIDRKYSDFFCSTGNKLFHRFDRDGYVLLTTQQGKNDISLFISKSSLVTAGKLKGQKFNLASNLIGYYYTAFFLALVFATPLTWKRKIIALALGFTIVTGFVMLILRVIILYDYTLASWIGLFQDAAAKESINFWYNYFGRSMTLGYSFVIIVGLGVCIGKKEWKNLNGVFSEITTNKKFGKRSPYPINSGSKSLFGKRSIV